MATTDGQTGNWEIATACDIDLAPLFADESTVLEIDERAIAYSLESLAAPGSEGKITFTAATMSHPKLASRYDGSAAGIAWYDKTQDNAHALVGVAGTPSERVSLRPRIYGLAAERVLRSAGLLYQFKPLPAWRPASQIQQTSVHELQHVADYQDSSLIEERDKVNRRLTTKARATMIGSTILAPLAVMEATAALEPGDTIMYLVAGALTFMLGNKQASSIIKRLRQKAYEESTLEKRAYATTGIAEHLPRIISVKPA
jgi:hypothetical protein